MQTTRPPPNPSNSHLHAHLYIALLEKIFLSVVSYNIGTVWVWYNCGPWRYGALWCVPGPPSIKVVHSTSGSDLLHEVWIIYSVEIQATGCPKIKFKNIHVPMECILLLIYFDFIIKIISKTVFNGGKSFSIKNDNQSIPYARFIVKYKGTN